MNDSLPARRSPTAWRAGPRVGQPRPATRWGSWSTSSGPSPPRPTGWRAGCRGPWRAGARGGGGTSSWARCSGPARGRPERLRPFRRRRRCSWSRPRTLGGRRRPRPDRRPGAGPGGRWSGCRQTGPSSWNNRLKEILLINPLRPLC